MGIFSFLKVKTKPKKTLSVESGAQDDADDDEYHLEQLTVTSFVMTDELRERHENELFLRRFGASIPKTGTFL